MENFFGVNYKAFEIFTIYLNMELTEEKKPIVLQNLVSIEDYAKIQRKSIKTIYNWLNDKKIVATDLFGKKVIDKTQSIKD